MRFVIKVLVSMSIIVLAVQVGRRHPTLGGLIATMPLTSLIVLLWLYSESPDNYPLLIDYTRGTLWGIVPSILFFCTAYLCFLNHLPLGVALSAGFAVWAIGAFVHQWILR
jgi:uncharacterized membrane protein (GlpM family)